MRKKSSRISLEDGYTLILVDIPTPEVRHEKKMYTTIPLGIILKNDAIITICREDTPVLNYFVRNKLKEFSTKKKMRFIYEMMFRSAMLYQAYLRGIIEKRTEIERVGDDTRYRYYRASRIRIDACILCYIFKGETFMLERLGDDTKT